MSKAGITKTSKSNKTSGHKQKGGSPEHNQHGFKKDKKDIYIKSYTGDGRSLKNDELDYFRKRYAGMLEKQNEKYIKSRQYGRTKTIEELYNSKRYMPAEEIHQYGHMNGEVPSKEDFIAITEEYMEWLRDWSAQHGYHLHVLNVACHFDEATPHFHARHIWDVKDPDGTLVISQEKAMQASGIELPDPNKPESRFNNRNITFTKMCRSKFQDICEKHGYQVDRSVNYADKRKHETVSQYHARKERELQKERNELYDEITNDYQQLSDDYDIINKDIQHKETALNARESNLNKREGKICLREQKVENELKNVITLKTQYENALDDLETFSREYQESHKEDPALTSAVSFYKDKQSALSKALSMAQDYHDGSNTAQSVFTK